MLRLMPLLLVVPLMLLPAAAPPTRYPTLSPKDAADGWLLLFDGESTFGWDVQGEAKVEGGKLVLGGKTATAAMTTAHFIACEVVIDCVWTGKNRPTLTVRGRDLVSALPSRWKTWTANTPMRLTVRAEGDRNQVLVVRKGDPRLYGKVRETFSGSRWAGAVGGVGFKVPEGNALEIQAIRLRPLGLGPLFTGKDLSGWKLFKGDPKREKSTFGVTKDGYLNVKNGPGDLQTEALYDDFVLQLECISNGKHLNSGIFFRAIPGEYQNGYEAQVQHDFSLVHPRKYLVDQYDPMTHKLTGKKEVLSPAKDFGTGAIYRRVPARRGVAKDGEWFTMTVVAQGRHFATWVNGVQQVDWTDHRAPHKNPRNGYRSEAGAISIQGHDPTTDLSFRNVRIVALPRMTK